jgi:hypothetical protein
MRMLRACGVLVLAVLAVTAVAACRVVPPAGRSAPAASAPPAPIAVTFTTPDGFVPAGNYTILVPLTPHRETQWRVPGSTAGTGLDVLFVNSYVLDRGVDGESDAQLRARVAGYARQVHAVRASTPTTATVAGYTGYQQQIEQPYDGGTLHYDSTFVFTDRYLVQVGCQWDQQRQAVDTACRTVLATLRIGAV